MISFLPLRPSQHSQGRRERHPAHSCRLLQDLLKSHTCLFTAASLGWAKATDVQPPIAFTECLSGSQTHANILSFNYFLLFLAFLSKNSCKNSKKSTTARLSSLLSLHLKIISLWQTGSSISRSTALPF